MSFNITQIGWKYSRVILELPKILRNFLFVSLEPLYGFWEHPVIPGNDILVS